MDKLFKQALISSSDNVLVQFFRYAIVGGVAAVVDILLYHLLTNVAGVYHLTANGISFVFGLLTNYFLSRQWVFNKKEHNFRKDFILFSIIGVMGLILQSMILYELLDLGMLQRVVFFLGYETIKLTAKLIAVFIVLFWNFIARKIIVFN